MALTGEKKFGYSDGQHLGYYGDQYPLFVRIRSGKVQVVAKELNPNSANVGKMVTVGRDWLKDVFKTNASDFDQFENSNGIIDATESAASFVTTSAYTASTYIRPNFSAATVPAATGGTTTGGTTVPTTGLTGGTTTGGTTTGGPTDSKIDWKKWGMIGAAVVVVVAAGYYFLVKKGKKK